MPTQKRYTDLRPISSGEQKLPSRFQHAADSSGNRPFIFLQFAKKKGGCRAHVQPYFPFLVKHTILCFYFFEHKKSLPTKYCIDSYLKYTSYGKFSGSPQRDLSDAFFLSVATLYCGMDIAD